jgi:sugar-specific transcriptional regulator TrmB
MKQEKATNLLQQLGFSSYESKAYLGLLTCHPATAYEVAKASGVPTSKIYETLGKLTTKGIVQPSEPHDKLTQLYVALKPEDFLQQIKESTISRANALLPLLEAVNEGPENDYIWHLPSFDALVSKVVSILSQAQHSILISCWAEELNWMKLDLLKAEARGLNIAFVHFGITTEKIGATYCHPVEKTLYQEKGGRGLTLVVDNHIVLIGNFKENGLLDASWSKNHTFVTVAEDYIKHDVYITKVTRFLNQEMLARFGKDYEQLRNIFDAEA